MTVRAIPEVRAPKRLRLPPHEDTTMRTGLRVLALRKPVVPRVEFRLRIPAGRAQDGSAGGARAMLFAEAMLTGTETRTAFQIAEHLQALGASLHAACGPDDLVVHGGVLRENLPALLDLVHDVVTGATFPAREVAIAADRLAQQIEIRRSQAMAVASEAVMRRTFGSHRYGRAQPDPARVVALRGPALRAHRDATLTPRGATLVLVGDLQPARALERAADAFGGWRGRAKPAYGARAEATPNPRPLVIDRPGSVQTAIRMALPGVNRRDPAYPALALADTVLAGSFISRLVKNIRETRGYCYSCGSFLDVRRLGASIGLGAPVGGDVTAPALREIRYELTRMATELVGATELDAAKRYLAGGALLSLQTQDVLTAAADGLLAEGCDLTYLETYAAMIHEVTAAEVLAVSQRFLTPARATTVLVGDAARISADLAPTDDVEVATTR